MSFVVDISLAAAWILPDEASPEGDRLLDGLQGSGVATVPSLFWYEARSLLTTAERRGRIDLGAAALHMAVVRRLPIVDKGIGDDGRVLDLARSRNLSAYDATYLALALAERLPLATLDRRLAEAARAEGVTILGPLA